MRLLLPAFILIISVAACGGSTGSTGSSSPSGSGTSASSAGGGSEGAYTSVNTDGLTFEFKSGGVVTMSAKDVNVSSTGSYTTDGEKLIVSIDGQQHTFVRDGKCIQEPRHIFGKLCKGGQAAEASNVSTRKPPVTEGTWTATNADGEFKIDFKPGNRLTLTATMAGGGKTSTDDGTFVIEGDRVHVQLPQGTPLILQFVNDVYESTSFGLPMKFVRK